MISIITPLYSRANAYILETYKSLCAQTLDDWEWIILENNGGVTPEAICQDPRVKVLHDTDAASCIGYLKRAASLAASHDYILELDADDLLHPEALGCTLLAFSEGADFVYSDNASFKTGTWESSWSGYPYGARHGWTHYETYYQGHKLLAMRAPPVTAQNLRLIYWAPDHLRAWRKSAYLGVGGHDAGMAVADDHDLIVRFFLAGKRFVHIPSCLYFYRIHPENTVSLRNAEIQRGTWANYNKYVFRLAEKFAQDGKLERVDLCGGIDAPKGYLILDQTLPKGRQGYKCDLDQVWPLLDNSVGLLRANDAVEHLRNPIHTMNEAWRVLAPGGWLMIDVPSTNGKGAFCDPTHVSFWNDLSFRYYTDPAYMRYVAAFRGRFQTARVIEWFPTPWHKERNVPYVQAHLIALKEGYSPMGALI